MPTFTPKKREELASKKLAQPDGSYPIRNRADLKRAIQAFGRSKNPEKTKAWIMRRAKELNATDLLPSSWTNNEAQHIDEVSEILLHAGVKGMHWGVRKKNSSIGKPVAPNRPGTRNYDPSNLSNKELKKVVARMKLEQEFANMNEKNKGKGKKFAEDFVRQSGSALLAVAVTATAGKVLKDVLESQSQSVSDKAVKKAAALSKKFAK